MVIFGAGVVTGGLLVGKTSPPAMIRQAMPQAQRAPTFAVPNVGGVRIEFLRKMQRELDLTPQQRTEVDRILTQSHERTRRLMEPITPQLREEVQRARERFRAVLTEGQKDRFDAMLKHQERGRDPRRDRPEKGPRSTQN